MPAPSDILQFLRGQLFQTPQLPHVSFQGKTIVVTGANSGIGFECARHLVQLNASHVVFGCRNIQKGEAAKKRILATTKTKDGKCGTKISVWELDMAKFVSVRAFAEKAKAELPRLDALLVNAGISTNEYHVADGFEETLTVNVVSPFLLCLLCLPQLRETAHQVKEPGHLMITGSNVHCFADHSQLVRPAEGKLFATLSDQEQADMAGRYFLSKLIVMLGVQAMSQVMLEKDGKAVIFNCPSPGWCKTELFRQDDGGPFGRNLLKLIGRTPEVGGRTLTSAIAAGEDTHGRYLSECQIKNSSVWVRSQEGKETQEKAWKELSEIMERIHPGVCAALDK